ncbi:MAG: tetratricopeptide repeat protein [Alphaproteobacteria bacterium]|nr:tetratricopeptide repeat protein [Alphaproteobacteria bacterium]
MDDIFHDIEDELRRDNLVKFFKNYGRYILAASAAIIIIACSILYWQHYQENARAQHADAYARALLATTQTDITQALNELEAIGKAGSGYASLAEFRRAALLMQSTAGATPNPENKAIAIKIYQDMAKDSKVDMKFRHLATVLLILATLDHEDPQKLLALLGTLSVGSNPWTPLASELTALLNFKMGNFKQAESLYKNLIEASQTPDSIRMRSHALLTRMKTGL